MDPLTGALIGGGMGLIGSHFTNQANAKSASDMSDKNAFQAQAQMEFQRTMSNTAHQREVADLKAAGLNPILSASGGGASTPGGAAGSAGMSTSENPLSQMASNMANLSKTKADIGLTQALTRKADVDATVASKGIPKADIINKLYNAGGSAINAVKNVYNQVSKTNADRKSSRKSGKTYEDDTMQGRWNMLKRGAGNLFGGPK